MNEGTQTEAPAKPYRPPPLPEDLNKALLAEAARKKTSPAKVFWYWLRIGMKAEPRINATLP
jgi:hypothetical protein